MSVKRKMTPTMPALKDSRRRRRRGLPEMKEAIRVMRKEAVTMMPMASTRWA